MKQCKSSVQQVVGGVCLSFLILYVVAHVLNSQVVWNNIHFVMWDLGGQESLRTAWNTYYSNTEFIILVIK